MPSHGYQNSNNRIFALFCAMLGSMTSIMLGYDTGVMSGAAIYIQRDLKISDNLLQILVGTINLYSLIGSAMAGRTSDWIGRKYTVMLSAGIFFFSAIIMGTAVNYPILMIGRFFAGIGVGYAFTIGPVYATELAPPSARGFLTSFPEIFTNFGVLLGYISNYFLSKQSLRLGWRLMLGIATIPSFIMAIIVLFMPESPRWLVMNGRLGEAERVLIRTSGSRSEAEEKLIAIKEAAGIPIDCRDEFIEVPKVEKGKEVWKELFLHPTPTVRRIMVAGIGLQFLQQATGIDAVVLYSPRIFKSAGITKDSALLAATMGVGCSKTFCVLVATFFLDRVGRRPLLLCSVGAMIISVALLATGLTVVYVNHEEKIPWAIGLSLAMVYVYVGVFSMGLGPTAWVYNSEIYPLRLRAQGSSIGTGMNRVVSGVIGTSFLSITKAMTTGGAFFMFCGVCIITWIFIYTLLPETKGKNLEDIGELFGSKDIDDHHDGPINSHSQGLISNQ